MGDLVNLRTARKRRDRAEHAKAAEDNRILHGRPKAERLAARVIHEREAAAHEAHRREPAAALPAEADDEA